MKTSQILERKFAKYMNESWTNTWTTTRQSETEYCQVSYLMPDRETRSNFRLVSRDFISYNL